ncbi:phosphotransferase family protein [Nocardiopsis metallicus]|uniref:Aminoglycoside phosphotransferase (APT) family kinase protein n=1 Tax=Nocardiopsis metallicus TaxID=179819 RepID=A0A840WGD5_9ACTN|nr:phosphotransferase [Nocardiopsis metallicus]MBB5495144.1 aminoglycoside phosphotransferase (APT) family kinase protein [Nocardiopsis metallicus]
MDEPGDEIEVVVAHSERATLRVGDVFLKVDTDQARVDAEVEAISLAPVPTPRVLWRKPPVLAISAVAGATLGSLGGTSTGSPTAWAAAGAAIRKLHEAPLPPRTGQAGRNTVALAAQLDKECAALVRGGLLPADLVTRNRRVAEAALRPWAPAFTHGDLQIAHVFLEGDEVTGIIDWSEAGRGDPLYDLATFTLGHEERLDDLLTGYGTDIDLDVIHGWWSLRSLLIVRWLSDHGFDPFAPGCEVDVLRSRM